MEKSFSLKSKFGFLSDIPKPVMRFLKRAVIIFISWKLLYYFVLMPAYVPDRQLTILTAKATSSIFNIFHHSESSYKEETFAHGHKTAFFVDGRRAIGIADNCNGLELMVLYIGFLFSIPLGFKKQLVYSIAGLAGIFILNILRCYALALLNLNRSSIADFAHHYLFTTIIYGLIFITWVQYSKPYFKNEE